MPHLEAANRYSVFFPSLIEIAKPSFISQRLVSHLAMWCLCRYASMPPQAPCGSGCFTQTQRYASAGPAVQGLASWLLAMDVHHNWYMANNHGLDVYNLYTYIYIHLQTSFRWDLPQLYQVISSYIKLHHRFSICWLSNRWGFPCPLWNRPQETCSADWIETAAESSRGRSLSRRP